MARGAAPRPSAQGELYGDEANDGEDIHQLAADVRAARAKVEEARKAWNKAVAVSMSLSMISHGCMICLSKTDIGCALEPISRAARCGRLR